MPSWRHGALLDVGREPTHLGTQCVRRALSEDRHTEGTLASFSNTVVLFLDQSGKFHRTITILNHLLIQKAFIMGMNIKNRFFKGI